MRGVSGEDWQRVVHGMIGVTQRGTAAAIGAHAPYVFAGKTGTAQVFTVARNEKYNAAKINERLRDHSWFIAFAPADAAAHRARGAGGERRRRCQRRGADRAQGAGCLPAGCRGQGEADLMMYEEVTSGSRTRRTLTGAARVLHGAEASTAR